MNIYQDNISVNLSESIGLGLSRSGSVDTTKKGSVVTMPNQASKLSRLFKDERLRKVQAGLTDDMSFEEVLGEKHNNRYRRSE